MKRKDRGRKRRTVLHIIDSLEFGGAQKLLALIAQWTPRSEYKTIVCVLQPSTDLKSRIEACGVPVYCFNRPRASIVIPHRFLSCFYHNVRDVLLLCRHEHVDVIQCHLTDAEFVGVFAGFLHGVRRIICTVHSPALLPPRPRTDIRNILRILVTKLMYRAVDHVIAVSDDVAGKLREAINPDPSKLTVIINRIDVQSFRNRPAAHGLKASLGLSPADRVIVTVARLMPPKGLDVLIDAISILSAECAGVKLLLIGDGDLRQGLEAQSSRLGLGNMISFLGSRDDIPDILALADVFVLPSLWEGTSMALLEAMAAGRPIVATDIPGNRAVLQHGENSMLVPAGNARALAGALSFLLQHPDTARAYGHKAYESASAKYDIRKTIEEHRALWQ